MGPKKLKLIARKHFGHMKVEYATLCAACIDSVYDSCCDCCSSQIGMK